MSTLYKIASLCLQYIDWSGHPSEIAFLLNVCTRSTRLIQYVYYQYWSIHNLRNTLQGQCLGGRISLQSILYIVFQHPNILLLNSVIETIYVFGSIYCRTLKIIICSQIVYHNINNVPWINKIECFKFKLYWNQNKLI